MRENPRQTELGRGSPHHLKAGVHTWLEKVVEVYWMEEKFVAFPETELVYSHWESRKQLSGR